MRSVKKKKLTKRKFRNIAVDTDDLANKDLTQLSFWPNIGPETFNNPIEPPLLPKNDKITFLQPSNSS